MTTQLNFKKHNVSNLSSKCIVIYNAWFFSEILCWMYKNNSDHAIDEAGTYWHIEDVQKILSQWKAA